MIMVAYSAIGRAESQRVTVMALEDAAEDINACCCATSRSLNLNPFSGFRRGFYYQNMLGLAILFIVFKEFVTKSDAPVLIAPPLFRLYIVCIRESVPI